MGDEGAGEVEEEEAAGGDDDDENDIIGEKDLGGGGVDTGFDDQEQAAAVSIAASQPGARVGSSRPGSRAPSAGGRGVGSNTGLGRQTDSKSDSAGGRRLCLSFVFFVFVYT